MGAQSSMIKQKLDRAESTRMLSLDGLKMAWKDVEKPLGKLPTLRTLDLQNNRLKGDLVPAVFGMTSLRKLHVGRNKLEGLGAEAKKLNNLEELTAEDNLIATVSADGVMALPKLKKLDLSRNRISVLAATPALMALKEVNLSHNALTLVPYGLFALPALVVVNLSHNSISAVTPDEGAVACKNLKELDLSHNAVTALAPALLSATLLSVLHLEGNNRVCKGPELRKAVGDEAYDAFMLRQKKTVDKQMQGGAVATLIHEK
eukprot:TRINITY_DN9214_c0_g1_i2.p1 TRINITY_DN9214_c0_g1~~TRINITY_DN9214_c0_g1_i2.p1  ORF type:complete len:261 (+),score=77.13 TRINITY_DN9214_c0_g1_i2:72-854(+)